MRDCYLADMATIEAEIGQAYLLQGTEESLSLRGRGQHTLRYHWRKAKRFLATAAQDTTDWSVCESLGNITAMGTILRAVRSLPGYASRIRPMLTTPAEYVKEEYVMSIAERILSRGCSVEFVEPSRMEGIRTPDLRVSHEGTVLWVECKRKNPVVETSLPEPTLKLLTDRFSQIIGAISEERDIQIAITNEGLSSIDLVLQEVSTLCQSNFLGVKFLREFEASIAVSSTVPPAPGVPPQTLTYLPGWASAGVGTRAFRFNSSGTIETGKHRRIVLHHFNAHSFSNAFSSFQSARGQIPKGEIGAIYIELDVSKIPLETVGTYLRLVGELMQARVWNGMNSRVALIVLTGSPIGMIAQSEQGIRVSVLSTPEARIGRPDLTSGTLACV